MSYLIYIFIITIIILIISIVKKNDIVNKMTDGDILVNMENGFVEAVLEESVDVIKEKEKEAIADVFSNKKFLEGDLNWKYTDANGNLDCWESWDYVKKNEDGSETIIAKNVIKTLKKNNRPWCPVSKITKESERREIDKPPTTMDIINEKTGNIWGLVGAVGLGLTEELITRALKKSATESAERLAKKASSEISDDILKKAGKEIYEESGEKLFKESSERIGRETMDKAGQETMEKIGKETKENILKKINKSFQDKIKNGLMKELKEKIGKDLKKEIMQNYGKKTLKSIQNDILTKASSVIKNKTSNISSKALSNAIRSKSYAIIREISIKQSGKAISNAVRSQIISKVTKQFHKILSISVYKNIMKSISSNISNYVSKKIARIILTKALIKAKIITVAKAFFRAQAKMFLDIGKSITKGMDDVVKMAVTLTKLSKTITKESIKNGVKMGFKSAGKLASKLKPGPLAIFDILSFALDTIDPMKYNNFMPTKDYIKAVEQSNIDRKEIIIAELAKLPQYKDIAVENIPYPIVMNPLDKLKAEDMEASIGLKMGQLFALSTMGETHKTIKAYIDKMNSDLKSGALTAEELERDDPNEESAHNKKMKTYYDLIDVDDIITVVSIDNCKRLGGLVVDGDKCTYNKEQCDKLYKWPLDDKNTPGREGETYAEFIVDKNAIGRCLMANPEIRHICETMDAEWDVKNNKCDIGFNYCLKKGGTWDKNKEECYIEDVQKIFEFILGTTVTRLGATAVRVTQEAIKGALDLFFEGCGYDGDFKIRDKCMDYGGGKAKIWDCNNTAAQKFYYNSKDYTIRPMSELNKCLDIPNANAKSGSELQIIECNGNNAQKFLYDEDNKQISSVLNQSLCFELEKDNTSNGTLIKLANCRDHQSQKFTLTRDKLRDAGATCMVEGDRTPDCPTGYTNNGATCGRGDHTAFMDSGRVADCPAGYTNNGATCGRGIHTAFTDSGRVADCPSGYTNNGATCGRGDSTAFWDSGRVADCPSGYTNNGATCGRGDSTAFWDSGRVADCPDGYINDGTQCRRDFATKTSNFGLGSYQSASCPKDYSNTGTTCHYWGHSFQRDYFSKAFSSIESDVKRCEERFGKGNCEIRGVSGSRLARAKNCQIEARHYNYNYPEDYVDDGVSTMGARCYRHAHTIGSIESHGVCPPKEDSRGKYTTKTGALCYVNCEREYGPEWYNNGTECARNVKWLGMSHMTCKEGEFKSGARCYKKCSENHGSDYTHDGTRCYRPASTLAMSSMTCKPEEWKSGARCYKKCSENHGSEYTHDGTRCYRPASTLGMGSMTCKTGEWKSGARCYKPCKEVWGDDYKHNLTSCYRDASTLPMSSMVCKEGEWKSGARCYKPCKEVWGDDYTHNGTSCYRPVSTLGSSALTCKPWERKVGLRCYTEILPGFTNMGVFQSRTKDKKDFLSGLLQNKAFVKLKSDTKKIGDDFRKSFNVN